MFVRLSNSIAALDVPPMGGTIVSISIFAHIVLRRAPRTHMGLGGATPDDAFFGFFKFARSMHETVVWVAC